LYYLIILFDHINRAHNVRKQTLEKRHRRVVEKIKSGKKTKTELQADVQRQRDRKEKTQTRRSEHRLFSKQYDLWGTGKNVDIYLI